MKKTLGPC